MPKNCLTCSRTFAPAGRAQRYCSPGCRASEHADYKRRRAVEKRGGPPRKRGPKAPPGQLEAARALRAEGLTLAAIGERLGVTRQRVHQILASG